MAERQFRSFVLAFFVVLPSNAPLRIFFFGSFWLPGAEYQTDCTQAVSFIVSKYGCVFAIELSITTNKKQSNLNN